MNNCTCIVCGKEFYARPCRIKIGKAKFCSNNCRACEKRMASFKSNEYIMRWAPWHPNANKHGHIYEHVLIGASVLARPLKKGEVIYHINRNRCDNRHNNLIICSKGYAQRLNTFGKKLTIEHKNNISESCKGKIVSDATKQKMATNRLGKPNLAVIGEKNPNWKGGITDEYLKLRTDIRHKIWRRIVFEADNYTCQECGDNKGGNLNAHHIKPFKTHINDRYNPTNGVTLCTPCHIKCHKKGGSINA